jgi:hypothetical protein
MQHHASRVQIPACAEVMLVFQKQGVGKCMVHDCQDIPASSQRREAPKQKQRKINTQQHYKDTVYSCKQMCIILQHSTGQSQVHTCSCSSIRLAGSIVGCRPYSDCAVLRTRLWAALVHRLHIGWAAAAKEDTLLQACSSAEHSMPRTTQQQQMIWSAVL